MRANWCPIFAVLALATGPVGAADPKSGQPQCDPNIKLLHFEIVRVGRPSPQQHTGQVRVSFTVAARGYVTSPRVVESTDPWLNDRAVASARTWRYEAPGHKCTNVGL